MRRIRFWVLAVVVLAAARPLAAQQTGASPSDVLLEEGISECDACSSCGESCVDCDPCGYLDPGVYYGVRAGAMLQDRDPFRYGRQADDSNNTAALGVETGLGVDDWAPAFDFYIGKQLNESWSAEARFGFAIFDASDAFTFAGSGNDDAQNSFWITRIDGVQAGPPGPAQGISGGIRFTQEANGTLDYDSDWYDFGADFVRHARASREAQVDYVIGPAFANTTQHYRQDVVGIFHGGQGRESHVAERLNEWFFGLKLGRRASRPLCRRLSLVSEWNVYLYYHTADFAGTQQIGGNGGPVNAMYNFAANDNRNNFVPRLELWAGLQYEVNDALSLGVSYRLGAWFNVSTVDNPDITLAGAEWFPDHAAQIAGEDILTHSVMGTAVLRR